MRSLRIPLAVSVAVALATTSCSGDDAGSDESSAVVGSAPDSGADPTDLRSTDAAGSADTQSVDSLDADEILDAIDDPDTTEPGSAGQGAVDQAAIDAAAATFLENQAAQGVTAFYVAVSDPDSGEYVSAYGDASVGGPAATVDDNFRIGSITKTATATMILQLVDSGVIALDDTVGGLAPDLAATHPEIEGLTVGQLLGMRSGIADYLNGTDVVLSDVVADPSRVWTAGELVAAGIGAGMTEPGTPGYSTTNYIILQLIAEEVTGSSLQDLIADNVTGPLGLDDLYLPTNDDTALPDPATHGYVDGTCVDELAEDGATVEAGTDTTDWSASFSQGGGAMTSTIADLLGWAESLSGSALLDPATAEQRVEMLEPLPEGVAYGLGIMEVGEWVGHEGEALGWEALAVQDPDTGVSIALAGNGCGGLFLGFLEVIDALYPATLGDPSGG